MVVPTKSFTIIADADIDPDSVISTELMVSYRDNDIHLEEWLGGSFVAAIDHRHNGVDSALVAGAQGFIPFNFGAVTLATPNVSGATRDVSIIVPDGAVTFKAILHARIVNSTAGTLTFDFTLELFGSTPVTVVSPAVNLSNAGGGTVTSDDEYIVTITGGLLADRFVEGGTKYLKAIMRATVISGVALGSVDFGDSDAVPGFTDEFGPMKTLL